MHVDKAVIEVSMFLVPYVDENHLVDVTFSAGILFYTLARIFQILVQQRQPTITSAIFYHILLRVFFLEDVVMSYLTVMANFVL